jgi:2-polyprenyl-3-methyl-5-hydroxy-6-metoxy-1,4-benzoquinol methylase
MPLESGSNERPLTLPVAERSTLVTNSFCQRVRTLLGAPGPRADAPSAEKRRFICSHLERDKSLCAAVGLSWVDVPEDIHVVGDRHNVGDLYSADLFVEAITANDIKLPSGARILDFGCSSGRLVRVLARYYNEAEFYGCDPRRKTIEWASANLAEARFFVNPEAPPMCDIPDEFFRAVVAISVWSHFSEQRALAWFAEMVRIIEPGGGLIFSTHGYRSLTHFDALSNGRSAKMNKVRRAALDRGEYHFMPYPATTQQAAELDTSHWGMAYASERWYRMHLSRDWVFREMLPGRLLANQDVYVFIRR